MIGWASDGNHLLAHHLSRTSTRSPTLATTTGTIDGRTWTNHGDDNTVTSDTARRSAQRYELANAIATVLAADALSTEVTVTPWPPKQIAPPAVYLEPDNPFYDPATFGTGYEVWAYRVNMVVSAAHHQHSWDWFERVAPKIDEAVRTYVPGGRFEQMDAPEEADIGEGRTYLVATGHVTIKQAKGS